ncbi:hypothetical protein CC86DRAFT_187751 [Ophiobolus disseminans]|uniref:Uncharacterized protein n=1 Tax=Ophiobolus disseminans TaxID=1469910 RepID=A0A6A7A972_9PLEO|nr:hypothetical protein CC86DRAFT_187751 [Ophiobolus disseminans]
MPHTGDMKPEKSMANGIRHQPPSRIFYAVQPPRSLISALREPAAPMKSQQVCRTGLQFVADGFVGCELDVISTTKPRQRARIDSRKGKHPSVGSALALASGSLPLPPNQGEVLSIVSQHVTTELSQSSVLAYSHEQAATAPSQLTLTKTQGTTENASPYHLSLTRWESAIRNQLSSIIAPVRRHSESSESEAITEHQSTLDDEDTFEDDSTEDTTYNPVHLGRRPTFSDDHSYFKRAMQELD